MLNWIPKSWLLYLGLALFLAGGASAAEGPPSGEAVSDDKAAKIEAKKREGEKAAAGAGKEQEQAYHIEADVTEGYTTGGERVLHGIGHVLITHGDTVINCDEIYSYEAKKMSTLIGNVRVVDKVKKYTLTSGYAEYYEEKKFVTATKSPVLVIRKDREVTITGDLMQMWTAEEYGEAVGNVHLVSRDVEGNGERLKYFGKDDRIELSGTPVVRQNDSRLAGDLITLFLEGEQAKRAIVEGQARLVYFARPEEKKTSREDARAAKLAEGAAAKDKGPEPPANSNPEADEDSTPRYLKDFEEKGANETDRPGRDPIAPAGDNEKGGTPEAISPGGAGEGLPVVKDAAGEEEAENNNPTGRIEAAGQKMIAEFAEGKIRTVDVIGDAEGHYWPFDEIGRETGEQTDTSGDTIKVILVDGEVKKIFVDGNAKGLYRPGEAEGRKGVTETAGDHMTIYVRENGVRRIVVEGHARGSYFTEEAPPAEESQNPGKETHAGPPAGKKG